VETGRRQAGLVENCKFRRIQTIPIIPCAGSGVCRIVIAPSQEKSPWVDNGFTKEYPFSIKPDKKLSLRDVMDLYRDYYQDTEFDQSKGITAGPFECPYRYTGPMDAGGDIGDPNVKLKEPGNVRYLFIAADTVMSVRREAGYPIPLEV